MESKTMKKVILSAVVVCCAGMGFFWQSHKAKESLKHQATCYLRM